MACFILQTQYLCTFEQYHFFSSQSGSGEKQHVMQFKNKIYKLWYLQSDRPVIFESEKITHNPHLQVFFNLGVYKAAQLTAKKILPEDCAPSNCITLLAYY